MIKRKVLLVVANYYNDIADDLVSGALKYINSNETIDDTFKIEHSIQKVPGAFEIPFIISSKRNLYDGFIALGCIIKGETYHFEVISNEVTRKLMDLSIDINKPIGFGLLTCHNKKQAKERSDPDKGNKGAEAAIGCFSGLFPKYING
ncbi:MAG: 6,7-dimethyl-8-ribityllumazine synthase 1 [Alphaproteobacteria bacterium MarineAlpha5_Bin8]|nr:MAG: 6,7-dimethyl-8-ribityllumazine synthase 1 [Alphaproteobacteria bacterium MarineAlpha5_Bin7]PPR46122.1 MAG: 6,7-dimethyl-8-ribityllumazine synthase 1 [Alphaproteobacteria bacterium MarineAlpha5_Bin8]PPR53264.1 MAG: 6,7-dimethyl-8-ribityllumazine synthase 1 [Alphaproteobacteria bacterium MarineAlpha5_Bin6]|tara:strand:- start:224 stop:667 length:444 start_codon:yes stop_codon:yes gene_type:complete